MPDSLIVCKEGGGAVWLEIHSMLPGAVDEVAPFAANRDMLSTLLYLELCKLFSHGMRNWVTLLRSASFSEGSKLAPS